MWASLIITSLAAFGFTLRAKAETGGTRYVFYNLK
jgi:hypothetical protein